MIPELDAQQTKSLGVRFRMVAVPEREALPNSHKTVAKLHPETGLPVYKNVEYIEICIPGQRDRVDRPVREDDKRRFAAQYREWKANESSGGEVGTPLSTLPAFPPSIVAELAHFNCKTVEQFAGMSDAALKNVGPYVEWRQKARAFLESTKANAPVSKLAEENEALRKRQEALEKQLQDILSKQAASEKKAEKSKQA